MNVLKAGDTDISRLRAREPGRVRHEHLAHGRREVARRHVIEAYAIYLETPPMRVAGGGGHGGGGLLGGGAGGGRSGGGDGGVDVNMLGGGGGGVRLGARERREAQRQRAVDVGVRLRAGVHGP